LNLTPVHIPLVIGVTASVIYPWRQWLSRSIMSKPQHLTKLLLLTFILLYSLYLIYIGGDAFGIRMAIGGSGDMHDFSRSHDCMPVIANQEFYQAFWCLLDINYFRY